ncbi:hypothetical protein ACF06O_30005 [Streptomyces albidoflavus]
MANQVHVRAPPRAIDWRTAEEKEGGHLEFGRWTWRDDPVPPGPSETEVRLTYGGSAVPASIREDLRRPPFGAGHLADRPRHLAAPATDGRDRPHRCPSTGAPTAHHPPPKRAT